MGSPTALATSQVASLPTHDPFVGRIVGSIMAAQKNNNKAEDVLLEGKCGAEPMRIEYKRQADGQVTADGYFGSVEIHERVDAAAASDGFESGKVFGQASTEQRNVIGRAQGSVAGQDDALKVAVERSSQEIPMSDALRARGRFTMTWEMKVGSSSMFGGPPVDTNMVPTQFSADTQPIATTDAIRVSGKIGDVELSRQMKWTVTTWANAYNKRDGWGGFKFFQAEDGEESETFRKGDEVTRTVQPFRFEVDGTRAHASGTLRTHVPGEEDRDTQVDRTYEEIPEKGAYVVTERFGGDRLEYSIYGGLK